MRIVERLGAALDGHSEELASANHSVAKVDKWEQAHFDEDEARNKVLEAKAEYEDALRRKFFDF